MGAAIWTAVVAAAKGGGADGDGGRVEGLPLTFEAPAPTAEALVHRWQCEEAGRKLVLDCAGQGMSFVEADGDIADDKLDDVRCLLHQGCPPASRSMTG